MSDRNLATELLSQMQEIGGVDIEGCFEGRVDLSCGAELQRSRHESSAHTKLFGGVKVVFVASHYHHFVWLQA